MIEYCVIKETKKKKENSNFDNRMTFTRITT
jgi:hypothetical protein